MHRLRNRRYAAPTAPPVHGYRSTLGARVSSAAVASRASRPRFRPCAGFVGRHEGPAATAPDGRSYTPCRYVGPQARRQRAARRGPEHHLILDSFDGVNASASTIATQLGAIAGQVTASKDDAGYALTAARLQAAASVFGAS